MHADQDRISFDWTAAHHFAGVDHLRRRSKRGLLFNAATLLIPLIVGLVFLHLFGGGLSHEGIVQVLWGFGAFAVIGTVFWAVFMSRPGRGLFFPRSRAIPCALEFDARGVTVEIGKSLLSYPWAKVRSVDEGAEYVFVLASSSACFAIPKSAFGSSVDAEHFATTMRRFLSGQGDR